MWEQLVDYMASNGVWALLFLALLVYQLQDSKRREEKYTSTITSLTQGLNALEGIKQDIKNIIQTIDSTVSGVQNIFPKRKSHAKSSASVEEEEKSDKSA
ncbi:MAG: hypothetical protein K5753_01200 [Clostridia bacterium]|nr:hypothetical protein [Clostridia bacterium]